METVEEFSYLPSPILKPPKNIYTTVYGHDGIETRVTDEKLPEYEARLSGEYQHWSSTRWGNALQGGDPPN